MISFIDRLSIGDYLPLIGSGETLPISAKAVTKSSRTEGPRRRQNKETNLTKEKRNPMSSLRNYAIQAVATLTLTSALGAFLYGVADLATRGVVIA